MPHFNIFRKSIALLLLTFYLISCHAKQDRKGSSEVVHFKTTDSSVLFFKNLRQSYYDKQENNVAKADIYRDPERSKDQTKPIINLAIVHHWRNETAYIMVEPNELLINEIRLEIKWQSSKNQDKGIYVFDFGDMEMQHKFATSLYESIQRQHFLKVKSNGKWLDLLSKEDEKEVFRKTMLDYLRLTNLASPTP
jgi:hypothetical protein